jgi:hypothetical protein
VLILFVVALLAWALVVIRRINREVQRDKELDESLAENTNRIIQSIDKLTEELSKSKDNKGAKKTTDS